MLTRPPVERVAAAVARACADSDDSHEMLASVADAVARAVPFDGSLWLGVDPATLLATAPGRVTGLDADQCTPFWDREFHVQDVGLYRDLARQPVPVSTLRQATYGHPNRSARYREFLMPHGYEDELRAVFRLGENAWGLLGLYREKGRPVFDDYDVSVVHAVSETIATALRDHVVTAAPWTATPATPGLLMFSAETRLLSSNTEATQWLRELDPTASDPRDGKAEPADWIRSLEGPGPFPLSMPSSIRPLIARARAVAAGLEPGPARLRLRGRNGRWLVLHATCLEGPGGGGAVAVMIEPAKSTEIAPIIIEAYSLTPRERDVLRCIARGLGTAEIAAELFLSTHTVRDYVKSVFDKVGVSSRGELVAKLFAEHYSDSFHADVVHAD